MGFLKHSQKWFKTIQVLKVILVPFFVCEVQIASDPGSSDSCGIPTKLFRWIDVKRGENGFVPLEIQLTVQLSMT